MTLPDSQDLEFLDAPTDQGASSEASMSKLRLHLPHLLKHEEDVPDYQILEEVGVGATGAVYKARQVSLNRIVALKILHGVNSEESDVWVRRSQLEAEAAGRLDHPGIVTIHEVGLAKGRPFISMAFVDGQSLSQRIAQSPLVSNDAAELVLKITEAVAHAHQRGVIHRDIKPANILLDREGQPRITDFGVARVLDGSSTISSESTCVGTPQYMPPEQADSRRGKTGPASDVYSLGAVLYACLTGRPPFQAASPAEVIGQVLNGELVAPRRLVASIPWQLEAITMKCLSREAKQRYATAAELADDLEHFLNGEPIVAKRMNGLRYLGYMFRRHVLFASVSGGAATVLLLVSLASAYSLVRTRQVAADQLVEIEELKREISSLETDLGTARRRQTEQQRQQFEVERLLDHATQATDEPALALLLLREAVLQTESTDAAITGSVLAAIQEVTDSIRRILPSATLERQQEIRQLIARLESTTWKELSPQVVQEKLKEIAGRDLTPIELKRFGINQAAGGQVSTREEN